MDDPPERVTVGVVALTTLDAQTRTPRPFDYGGYYQRYTDSENAEDSADEFGGVH